MTVRITKLVVGRTFNLGNFQSLRVELEAEIDKPDTIATAGLDLNDKLNAMRDLLGVDYVRACNIAANPSKYSKADVVEAQEFIDNLKDVLHRE